MVRIGSAGLAWCSSPDNLAESIGLRLRINMLVHHDHSDYSDDLGADQFTNKKLFQYFCC